MREAAPGCDLSVVVPVFNEVESLPRLVNQLEAALAPLNLEWEAVLVDDGSSDGSDALLDRLAAENEGLRVLHFRRNFGQTAALSAGIDAARGETIVTLDADLQNDPADIPRLLAKLDEGYDVVSGWRENRQDEGPRMFVSRVANRMISWITGVPLHDYGCTLKAYRRDVIKDVRLYGEMHRFIPAWASWVGARVVEMPVRHHPREFGRSKYGMGRIYKVLLDLLTVVFMLKFSTKPIRIFGGVGLACGAFSGLLFVVVAAMRLFMDHHIVRNPLFMIAILFAFSALQFLAMGLLGEIAVRTYHESQNKPIYYLRDDRAKKENGGR
jgi:glycosyltransferase involved in cell wall biosynthesis